VRSVFFNVFQSLVVLLYVLDNETNFVVKISIFIGLAIELWKIHKVIDIKVNDIRCEVLPYDYCCFFFVLVMPKLCVVFNAFISFTLLQKTKVVNCIIFVCRCLTFMFEMLADTHILREGVRVDLSGRLHSKIVNPQMVTYISTNWA